MRPYVPLNPIIEMTFRPCEAERCTEHGKRIAEVTSIRPKYGDSVQYESGELIAHLDDDFLGVKVPSFCVINLPGWGQPFAPALGGGR